MRKNIVRENTERRIIMVWDSERQSKRARQQAAAAYANGKTVNTKDIVPFLETVIHPNDRVVLEGCNQKQASFLSKALASADPGKVNGLNGPYLQLTAFHHLRHLFALNAGKSEVQLSADSFFKQFQMLVPGNRRDDHIQSVYLPRICGR